MTVAFVARGTKAGVRTSPCAVAMRPRRAREPGSRASIVKAGAGRASRGRAMRRAMLADGRGRRPRDPRPRRRPAAPPAARLARRAG